jgi:predicted nucleotidyltransferase
MSNTEDRLNRIIANHNESQQTASNRLDRVISNYSSRITNTPSQLQRRNMSTVQRLNAKVNNMMSNNSDILAEIRRRQEEQRRLKEIQDKQKQEEMRQLNNKIKNLSDEEKEAISNQVQKQNMQLKAYNADNVSKDLGVSKEEAEKLMKQASEKGYSMSDLSRDIKYSNWGETPQGKLARGTIDTINNAGTVLDSAIRGADSGGADFLSYATRLTKKKDELLDNMGTWGKVIGVATGDTEYLFNKDSNRDEETKGIIDSLGKFKADNNEQLDYNRKVVEANSNTNVAKKLNELAPSIGNNAVGAGIGMLSPTAGTMYFIGSAGGGYYDDAVQRGMNEDQALLYGSVMGVMEGLTEKVALGQTTKAGMMLGKGELGKALTETGISLGENFIQEAIMEPIQETSAMLIGGKDKADFSNMGQRMLQSGIDGALSAILMEGATAGVQSAVNVQDKIESGQKVSEKEIQLALLDIQASKKVDIEAKFRQEVQYQVQKASREYAEKNNIPNLQQNNTINQNTNQQQQISQVKNKNSLNQNVEGQSETKFSKILNNQKLPMQSYVYEKSDNLKVDSLRQQANKYFNNSPEAHNFVNMLEKIITDKNIAINFDTNMAKDVNGYYNNGVITINPNSSRAGEFLAIHELTHAIGTDSMIKMIDNYRKSNAEFDSQVQKLLQKYNKSEISEEALADIAGQLFGNQEYINNLSKTNPNMFKRIYNEIKYLWHQFTGYKNQEQFVDDLMFKWEQAYRNNNTLNQSVAKESKKLGGYNPEINVFTENIKKYNIKNIDNKYEVIKKVADGLKARYLSTEKQSKPITNIDTGMEIEIWKGGIDETFGNDKYYADLPTELKKAKIATMESLAKLIKYGEVRGKESRNYHDPKSKVRYAYLIAPINIDGTKYNVKMDIRKSPRGENRFYIHSLEINNKAELSSPHSELLMDNSASNNSIAPSNENVNTAKYSMQESENNSGSFNLPQKQIQGLENYSRDEIKDIAQKYIQEKLQENGLDDINIIDSEIHGSRNRGTANENSDLDIVVEYDGDIREDDLFDMLNEEPLYIDGIKVDINPITASKTGTLQEYMEKSNKYDQEILDKNKSSNLTGIESKQYLEQKFKELTGDSILKADAVLGGVDLRNSTRNDGQVEKYPYSKEALDIYNKYKNSKKSSNYLYHSTSKENIKNIIKNGLTIGNKQNQEGISAKDKLYLSATEELAQSFAPEDNVTFRINPKANLENLNNDLLGGEGSYTITNNIPANMLQVKENGKWINLEKSQIYKDNSSIILPKNHKQQQLEIVLESNPMQDDYHTGIRELEDIKTLSETLQDKDWADYDEFNPDLSRKDIEEAIETGKITVYSSYPIEQGTFISPSRMEAESYSGDGKIYTKEVDINDVAWIDPTQGQYAKINGNDISSLPKTDNKGNVLSQQQQEYFMDSKVRDENGKLLEVYHGTEANAGIPQEHWFTIFDLNHTRPSTLGDGFYFTEDYERASSYAHSKGNVYKVYLNITNPFIKADNQTFSEAIREINPNYDIRKLYGNEHEASRFDGVKLRKYLIDNGYDGISLQGTYVAFYPEQIKNVNNQNPTSNPDIRYSKNSNTWQEYLEKEFPAKGTRTNMQDIKQGTNLPTGKNAKETTNKADINLPPKVSANNQYKDTTTKVRKHYKSIIESANTTPEAKAIAKKLMGTDTYIPETNKSELERADEKIMNSTPESELNSLMSRATVGEKITPVDIAVGERLIEYYSKTGDKAKLQDAIQATAMAGTTAGQTVQAMSLLNHMTPQGQAVWLQRSVDKMNNKLKKTRGKNAQQFTLTDDMLQKIVSSENEEQLAKNLDEVYQELGQQVSKSTMEKIDAWRYFSMLANPRTHIRNIGGNVAMGKVQTGKNKVAGVIEATVAKFNPNMERTHTIVPASKEVRQFAKADIKNVTDRLGLTEGKLNPQTRLENNMKTFKHDAMNKTVGKLFDLNNKALEVEDGWGLKAGYVKALAEYMTANKLKPDTITDAQLSKARNYAVQQAKEATFHQENQLASLVNQLSNRNRFAKFGVDAVLPFKKTPMNIAKTGIEYSPVGLAKSMVLDTVQLRKGNITVNQYIDNISKGLTGTGIALVGYALAQAGILKASGGDDDKEKYEEGRGKQAFSIQIGDNTYSLDWLAPTAIPLFIGAEISALNRATNETKTSNSSDEDSKYNQLLKSTTNVLDAFTNSMNPMMEMSMLSGLASTLRSYEQGATQGITAMGTNALKSYVNQFFPTAMGQVAKTMDPYERSTTSTKSGMLPKAVDSTKNQIMAKVPGLRQMLPTKTDVWGNEMKQPENVVQRALENAVLPYTRKEVNNNDVDQELVRLYEERGEKAVLPSSSLSKDLTFSGEKYKMTSEEFAKYKKDYGSKSYSLINDLVNSSDYNRLSDEDKQQALENVYKYAKEYAKDQYAEANDIDYKKDTMFKTAQEMEKSGNVSSYFNYLAKTDGMKEKEKMNVLVKASYENNDKKLIYTNTIGSDDKLYNDAMKYTGININEYLKYKQQEFTSDKTDDGTVDGKSVSGSKKAKVYDYVNKMKITGEQRMLLLGTQYKLTNEERATLANYVKNLRITKNEKLEIYKKLQGFTVYKDGRVTY